MTSETVREISANSEVLKRLAKYLAQQCFRKTILEDLHAGITRTRRSATTQTWSYGRTTGRFPGQTFRG